MKCALAIVSLLLSCGDPRMPDNGPPRRPSQIKSGERFRLELSRKGCFGPCPQYDLVVSSDGAAILNARRYMPLEGSATAQLNPGYLRRIVREAQFNSAQCAVIIPDAEVIRLMVIDGSSRHSVECSLAGSQTASLSALVAEIHAVVLQASWVHKS